MNSITFCVGYILAVVMVRVSNADFEVFSEEKTTHVGPFNFSFEWGKFLSMEITVKNIPPSVTAVYLVFTHDYKYSTSPNDRGKTNRTKVPDKHIKNGESKLRIAAIPLKYFNIMVDLELETKEGLCHTSRVAEGRYPSPNWYSSEGHKDIYWDTNWKYDDTNACLVPNRCEIVMDFKNQCQEGLKCNVKEDKYICTFRTGKLDSHKSFFYQTYDTDEPRTKATFREDYTYLEAVNSFYKIHKTSKSWYEAKQVCAQEGAILFYPENSDEANAVISFWNHTSIKKDYMWVGISDIETEGVFVTVDGRSISEVYQKWLGGQPDNYMDGEDCLHILENGVYNDIKCDSDWCRFICKKSLLQKFQLDLSSVIGTPLNSSAMNTKLIFELELFDNNTSVHAVMPTSKKIYRSDKLILTAKDFVEKRNIVRTVQYSETTEVKFTCEEYKTRSQFIYVALISPTTKKIQTFEKTQTFRRKFKKSESGSILCCLYYVFEPTNDGRDLQIRRFVVNKNLFIYMPEVSTPPNTEGMQDQASSSESSNYNWLLYVLSAFLGVSALVLALYMIPKQRWCTKTQPVEETAELDAHVEPDQVLYASLEFVNNRNRPRIENEESHYAHIVGVLHQH